MDDKGIDRREFLKLSGLAAGASLAPIAGMELARKASAADRSAGFLHKRPWWVREVEVPTIGAVNPDEFKRFSGASIFALYKGIKDERDGEGAYAAEQEAKAERVRRWMEEGKPGFGLRDRMVYDASWTVMRSASAGSGILSWNRIRVPTPEDLGVGRYEDTPEEMTKTVKSAARLYGAALVGIASMNSKYVNLKESGRDVVFRDVEEPAVTEDEMVIPTSMRSVISVAIQMDLDLITRVPTAVGAGASSLGYSHCAFVVSTLAEFIRGLGYQAIPSVNDTAQSVPFAVDAGLGEMSRMN
ncbi:MAG: reductive dehalogenase domain-containing protein, partial [Anaerolineales bacterium]